MVLRLGLNCEYLVDWRRKKEQLIANIDRLERAILSLTPGTQEHDETCDFAQQLRVQLHEEYGHFW